MRWRLWIRFWKRPSVWRCVTHSVRSEPEWRHMRNSITHRWIRSWRKRQPRHRPSTPPVKPHVWRRWNAMSAKLKNNLSSGSWTECDSWKGLNRSKRRWKFTCVKYASRKRRKRFVDKMRLVVRLKKLPWLTQSNSFWNRNRRNWLKNKSVRLRPICVLKRPESRPC